jgi:hypothetical protein
MGLLTALRSRFGMVMCFTVPDSSSSSSASSVDSAYASSTVSSTASCRSSSLVPPGDIDPRLDGGNTDGCERSPTHSSATIGAFISTSHTSNPRTSNSITMPARVPTVINTSHPL